MKKQIDRVQLEAQWQSDPSLREEFNFDIDIFLAYKKAEANGQVKLYSRPS